MIRLFNVKKRRGIIALLFCLCFTTGGSFNIANAKVTSGKEIVSHEKRETTVSEENNTEKMESADLEELDGAGVIVNEKDLGNGYVYVEELMEDNNNVSTRSTSKTYTKTHTVKKSDTGEIVFVVVQTTAWRYTYGISVSFVSGSNSITTLKKGYSVTAGSASVTSPYNGSIKYGKEYTLKDSKGNYVLKNNVFSTLANVYGQIM